MAIQLFNTLTRKKEEFVPLDPAQVRMYNCGPTVYSFAHIGNFATFLLADLLRRTLEYLGFPVLQVMNITDVGHLTDDAAPDSRGEDKLEKKAREEKKDPWQIARFYEDAFHRDRRALHILEAFKYPRATDHVPEMIAMIEELLDAGLAYRAGDQVYFEIARFPRYGILSGNSPDQLLAGAGERVEDDPHKRNPLDFTLWKRDPKHIMQWDSPWGRGFPGWHIECSAMSRKYLGEVFDIHTGGEDNIFPHHECEIAQSAGKVGRIFSRYWLHRRHILVNGKKMSKREGNFFTLSDLEKKGYSGAEVRYALSSAHYRAQLNFTLEGLDAARESIRRMLNFIDDLSHRPEGGGADGPGVEDLAAQADSRFRAALSDDLNISAALAVVFDFIRDANKAVKTRGAGQAAVARLLAWDRVLGLDLEKLWTQSGKATVRMPAAGPGQTARPPEGAMAPQEIERLVAEREVARKARDFRRSDEIRQLLKDRGVTIKDSAQGPRWSWD
jgi:cysteinyl-tRNA synthetase